MALKFMALIALVASLAGCGGGTERTIPSVSFYGDSLLSGYIDDGRLSPTPVQRMTEYGDGAFVGVDYSHPGSTVWHAVEGIDGLPFKNWQTAMETDRSEVVVIRYFASALERPNDLAGYLATLEGMVKLAQARGKTVVLLGCSWIAIPNHRYGYPIEFSLAVIATMDRFEFATKGLAARLGVPFIEVRQVPFNGPSDIADNIHPNRAYSDRMGAYIVSHLLPIVNGLP